MPITKASGNSVTAGAKGDLVVGSATNDSAILAVGNNGETLVADSSASTGLRWQETYAAGKNKIINGAMLIDQRNAGASVSVNSNTVFFGPDRWRCVGQPTDGVFSVQQDSSVPAGFEKSLKVTATTADASIGTTQSYNVGTRIEGFDCANLSWGTSGAKTITLSFWVRSSLTGTFGGSLRNSAANRSYPFSYSVAVADTWEKKSIIIAGDTSGTWLKDSGIGINLNFSIGSGTDVNGTAGAWAGANYVGATGQVNVIGTLNATWYITGVQLEIGSVATAFTNAGGTLAGELAACQRYYYRISKAASANLHGQFAVGSANSTTTPKGLVHFPVAMRVPPTTLDYANISCTDAGNGGTLVVTNITTGGSNGTETTQYLSGDTTDTLTAYSRVYFWGFYSTTNTKYIGWSAEL